MAETALARSNMIEQQIRPWEVFDRQVLELLDALPREQFVPEAYQQLAYADTEIPIGFGENMMFPRIEAKLLQLLAIQPEDNALEIGTGSGYLTACLANLAASVVSIEQHASLSESAAGKISEQGISNVEFRTGDAFAVMDELSDAFDVIAVTGSVPSQTQADVFKRLLNVGGRMVIIIGTAPVMELHLITRIDQDDYRDEVILETEQAPLIGAVQPEGFEF